MAIDINLIRNKQRILITGNSEVSAIIEMIQHVFEYVKKDFSLFHEKTGNAPILFLAASEETEIEPGAFAKFEPHILLIHGIKEKGMPAGYTSFESYIAQFEDAADMLPKAGSYIYNEDDDVANMIGTKAREDVNNIKYKKLTDKDLPVYLRDRDAAFIEHASAVHALTKRVGITSEKFFEALSKK
ncbi:MAG: hypothetical protein RIA69_21180 [Cyclobacteriaceae bacterium]